MKPTRFIFFIFLISTPLFATVSFADPGNDIPEGIISAIKSGNSSGLAAFFNANVELVILDKEDVYSKVQAEQIVKDFFSKNKPSNFTILHQGGKEGAKYAIGSLVTNTGTYRVYFLIKNTGKKPVIHQFRIETQEKQ